MIGKIIIAIFIIVYVFYWLYLKQYFEMRKVFKVLKRFLEARDSLVLKLIPEVSDKKVLKEVLEGIEERKLNFSSGQNNAIMSDIKLNAKLKNFYDKYNQKEKNELEKEIFSKILSAEQNLKHIRKEYNQVVERYNQHLIRHKTICLKVIKMKPLDIYG